MKRKYSVSRALLAVFLCLTTIVSMAAPQTDFKVGRDYVEIKKPIAPIDEKSKQIEVIEFFSYGCHSCFKLEGTLQKWLKRKNKAVVFERVPVTFNRASWEHLAKGYYIADALEIDNKVSPAFFSALHEHQRNLTDKEEMAKFFGEHGVKRTEFDNAYSFSPGIDIRLKRGEQLTREYDIMAVPTVIVAGKYKIDARMVKGEGERMIAVIEYLIEKQQRQTS